MFASDANRFLADKCGWWFLNDLRNRMVVLHRGDKFLTAQMEEELFGDERKREPLPEVAFCSNPALVEEMKAHTTEGKHRAKFLKVLDEEGQEAAAIWLVENFPE